MRLEELEKLVYTPIRMDKKDWFFLMALAALFVVLLALFIDISVHPAEDAAIVLRYSEHVAQGHGMVWNIGEEPVDGATDFLFTVVVAGLIKLGFEVVDAARLMGALSLFVAVVLIYISTRRLSNGNRWLALFCSIYLMLSPALRLIEAGFGTNLFLLFACVCWYFATMIIEGNRTHLTFLLFSFSGLLMGLSRPEGVLLACFMLAGVVCYTGWRAAVPFVVDFGLVFLLVGGVYFVWRWKYFGYPLPNPYYKKGGGNVYPQSLVRSVVNVLLLTAPLVPVFILSICSKRAVRRAVSAFIPVIGFTAIWLLLSNEMNVYGRFQLPVLPLILMLWPALLVDIWKGIKMPSLATLPQRTRLALVAVAATVLMGALAYQFTLTNRFGRRLTQGKYEVAMALSKYTHRGFTLASAEAGILPLYSKWRTIDTWGLNDPWIAHHGQITEGYLDKYKPQVIMFHAFFSPIASKASEGPSLEMKRVLMRYAEKNRYCLAAVYGLTPYETNYYYVRTDFSEHEEIVDAIRSVNYTWSESRLKCINYALCSMSK